MRKILLIDDTPEIREALSLVLETDGWSVVTAGSASEADQQLTAGGAPVEDSTAPGTECPVDLVILDIWMPGTDGLTYLKSLKRRYPSLPVIIISGGSAQRSLENATAVATLRGAAAVLIKPFDDGDLLEAVHAALQA